MSRILPRLHSNNEYNRCLGEVANIGTGHEVSIGETVELLSDLMGVSVAVIQDNLRERPAASEVERLVACTSRAQELFGWKPEWPLGDSGPC